MIKFIKNNPITTSLIIFLLLFSFNAEHLFAANCSNYGGSTTYCDDGTSYSNYGGSTTYGSDGSSYSNYGGSTTYGSDGSTYNDYGGSTTYGSGGKMIEVGGGDDTSQNNWSGSNISESDRSKTIDANERNNIPSDRWNDIESMLAPAVNSKQENNQQSADEQANSYDPIPSLDNNLDNSQTNQSVSEINQKTQNEERLFIWWNPLTWWDYFFNKPIVSVNNSKEESIKPIEHEMPPSSFEWKEYNSDAGKFIALFPQDVTHSNWMDSATMKKLGWNNISKIDVFDAKTNSDEHFSVWFHQYTNKNIATNQNTLKTSLYNLLNLMKDYKLTFADYSKHGAYDALDYSIFNERENKYEKGRFIAAKQNVYQIFVDYKEKNLSDVDINKFFSSFYPQ